MTLLIPKGDNLVTYYMLPLVNVNKLTFGRSFSTSYINKKGTKIFIEMHYQMITPNYKLTSTFESDIIIDDLTFAIFRIPEEFKADANLFITGDYSKMSKEAKQLIYKTSTLPYNTTMDSFKVSHPVLQALGKTKRLRTYLLEYLRVDELADSDELIEAPIDSWFIEYRVNTLTIKT